MISSTFRLTAVAALLRKCSVQDVQVYLETCSTQLPHFCLFQSSLFRSSRQQPKLWPTMFTTYCTHPCTRQPQTHARMSHRSRTDFSSSTSSFLLTAHRRTRRTMKVQGHGKHGTLSSAELWSPTLEASSHHRLPLQHLWHCNPQVKTAPHWALTSR